MLTLSINYQTCEIQKLTFVNNTDTTSSLAILQKLSTVNQLTAKTEANNHAYYQNLIKDGTANGAASNAYLTHNIIQCPL